jgi:prevent-host-death family protein
MDGTWQVQQARKRLSELLQRVLDEGPQVITRRGRPIAKVVAVDAALPAAATSKTASDDDGFVEFLLAIPQSAEALPTMPRRARNGSPFDDVA